MLILTRRPVETIYIGDEVTVTVLEWLAIRCASASKHPATSSLIAQKYTNEKNAPHSRTGIRAMPSRKARPGTEFPVLRERQCEMAMFSRKRRLSPIPIRIGNR